MLVLLLCAGCSGGPPTSDPAPTAPAADSVVARYVDTTITLSEFESAYRNASSLPPPSADSLAAAQDFLEQYLNYRLKVHAARDAGLDTLRSVRAEIKSYRHELARPRLLREEVYEPVVRTLHERQQTEVDVSHIIKRVSSATAPEDTLAALREMQAIADSARQGVPFGDLAYRHSDAPAAQREGEPGYRGRLGYVRAGQLVEPFEDRMYTLPPDSVSDVFRSRYGYHLIKVHDRRPTQPPVRLSHIMIRSDETAGPGRALLDSLRTAIVEGQTSFEDAARTYSEDQRSGSQGGDLGMIESLQALPPAFREVVPALDSIGAVSPVVESQYGLHLVKLTDRQEQPSFEEAYDDLKEQVSGQPRVERRRTAFLRRVQREAGVRIDTTRLLRHAPVPSLDTLSRPLLSLVDADTTARVPVATLGDSTFTLDQLSRHVMKTDGGAQMTVAEVLQDFLDEKALRYAEVRLEERDAAFAARMREYREGVLAFQFMQDSVWTPAARDTSALRRTFRANRDAYRFPDRVRTIAVSAPADSLLSPYAPDTTHSAPPRPLEAARSDSLVNLDTTFVSDSSSDVYRRVLSVSDGTTIGPIAHDDRSLLLRRVERVLARRKTFQEARSSVVQDYQDRYEDRVLDRLRRRYRVETYPERLRHAFDNQ
jgi:peptidyl-prolyl cis-trans isomerase SurA